LPLGALGTLLLRDQATRFNLKRTSNIARMASHRLCLSDREGHLINTVNSVLAKRIYAWT
jgi:hypothetical protein